MATIFKRAVCYFRDHEGNLIVTPTQDWTCQPCLDQFPRRIREAVAKLDIHGEFEVEALLAGGMHGAGFHAAVVDDLQCYLAVALMETQEPLSPRTAAARLAFPKHGDELLRSPLAELLAVIAREGDMGAYAEPDRVQDEEHER